MFVKNIVIERRPGEGKVPEEVAYKMFEFFNKVRFNSYTEMNVEDESKVVFNFTATTQEELDNIVGEFYACQK